jgi:hypothetical protein
MSRHHTNHSNVEKNAVSNTCDKAEIFARMIRMAFITIKDMNLMHSTTDEIKNAYNKFHTASDASWDVLVAAKQTRQISATQETYALQTFMSDIDTDMKMFALKQDNTQDNTQYKKELSWNKVRSAVITAMHRANDLMVTWDTALRAIQTEEETMKQRMVGVSTALKRAADAKNKIVEAQTKIIEMIPKGRVDPRISDPIKNAGLQKAAQNAIHVASQASWDTLLAAQHTYQKNTNHLDTKEKEAARTTSELQMTMSNIATMMSVFPKAPFIEQPGLRNDIHAALTKAHTSAEKVESMWRGLLQNSSQEAGGKTRRNKKSHRARSRPRRHYVSKPNHAPLL